MRKNAAKSKCSTIHLESAMRVPAILSRKGRRLWAGAQAPSDEATRMMSVSGPDGYETLTMEPEPAEWQDACDCPSDQLEVKLQPQTAE